MSAAEMRCAYCGRTFPWFSRLWWPSSIYAECWTCAMPADPNPFPRMLRLWRKK